MSFNSNFYNNFAFHGNYQVPANVSVPPPPPPPYYIQQKVLSDEEFIKTFENKIQTVQTKVKLKSITILEAQDRLRNLLALIDNLRNKEKLLRDNINVYSEQEWMSTMNEIKRDKDLADGLTFQINDEYLNEIKKIIAKRNAKRLRQKRLRAERSQFKRETRKQWEENARRIDESLQKIKDDIIKAEEEEQAKIQTDIVLREVSRKKHDAKKYIAKLDALIKLRKARENTAKGRGMAVSEHEAVDFNESMERIKSLWVTKLAAYEKEEVELRTKLKDAEKKGDQMNEMESNVIKDLEQWKKFMFGSVTNPQTDFHGDTARFVAVRCQWDQYIDKNGSPLPVGWVIPS